MTIWDSERAAYEQYEATIERAQTALRNALEAAKIDLARNLSQAREVRHMGDRTRADYTAAEHQKAVLYVNSLRVPAKRAYAEAFHRYLFGQRTTEPGVPDVLPERDAEAIRLRLAELLPEHYA